MALNYSDPVTRGNPADKFRRYDQRQATTMTGVVRFVSPLYELEGGAVVYVHQLRTYVKADIAIGHTSHNGVGDYTPLSVGDYVNLTFSNGMASNAVITSTIPKQPDVSQLVEDGAIPAPDTPIEGQQANPRPVGYYNDALAELNRTTVSVRRLEGLRTTSPVTGSGIAAEQPGSIFASSPFGDETIIVPGDYRIFASNITITNNASVLDASDAVVSEALQYRQFIETQKQLFEPYPFDLTGATLSVNEDFRLGSAQQGTYERTLELYDEMSTAALTRLEEAQDLSQKLDDFTSQCIAPYIDAVKNHWSLIFGALLEEGLSALNEQLPEGLNVAITQAEGGGISGINVGPINFDPSSGKVSIEGDDYSLTDLALSELNKRVPLYQQVSSSSSAVLIGDEQFGLGLEEIVSGGVAIDKENQHAIVNGVKYSIANQGAAALNQRLPPELQLSYEYDEETGTFKSFSVGPLQLDPTTGQAKFDPSALVPAAKQLASRLPPAFTTAARLLSQVVDIPGAEVVGEILGIGGESDPKQDSLSTASTEAACGVVNQTLPQLIRTLGSAVGIDIPLPETEEAPQTLSAAALAPTPSYYSNTAFFSAIRQSYSAEAVFILKGYQPTPPHAFVQPSNGLDFTTRPYQAVASLLTSYSLPNALSVVENLYDLRTNGSLFQLIDVVQYSGSTPLFTATALLSVALGRSPDLQKARLVSAVSVTCSGLAEFSSAITLISPANVPDFMQRELGITALPLDQLIANPLSILDWAIEIEPGLAKALGALKSADYLQFLLELTYYHTGRKISLHGPAYAQLSQWVARAFSPALLGAQA